MQIIILIGLIILVPICYGIYKLYVNYKDNKRKQRLRECWGKEIKRERDFSNIKLYYERKKKEREKEYIDDQTWNDLDLNSIFEKLDRTLSTPGESILYYILRNPLFDEKAIKSRDRKIDIFLRNKKLREKVRLILDKLNRERNNNITDLLWSELPEPVPFNWLFSFQAILGLLSLISIAFLGGEGIIFLAIVLLINYAIIRYFKKKYFYQLPIESITYLTKMIKTAKKIKGIMSGEFSAEKKKLQKIIEGGSKSIKVNKIPFAPTIFRRNGYLLLLYKYTLIIRGTKFQFIPTCNQR